MEVKTRKIASTDISVIIQGPLLWNKLEGIERCIASIRFVAPEAEIIVSTWRSEDTSLLSTGVKLVLSDDPGCYWENPHRAYNLNRQLVSTAAGLSAATRPYALKIRSDLALFDDRLLHIAEPKRPSICKAKITITNLYVRNPEIYPLLFHVSDIIQFGRREDMLNYWASQTFAESEVLQPMDKMKLLSLLARSRFKLVPEQALTIAWVNRNGYNISLSKVNDTNTVSLASWAKVLTENFHLVPWHNSGVVFPARFLLDSSIRSSLLQPEDIPRILKVGFDEKLVRRAQIFGASFLVHGRLSYFIGWLKFNFPRIHDVLQRFWQLLLKVRTA